jgi:type IV pilus assembly protein PilY1
MTRALSVRTPATRRHLHRLLAGAAGAAAFAVSPAARAQADLSPPLPDVLLLVDTSGSMEFKTDGSAPTCNAGQPNLLNERSRWIDLVEVMTGTIQNYSCEKLDRSTAAFVNEYKFGTYDPYDFQYSIPYTRPLSNGCGPGAGAKFTGATNPLIWPSSNAIGFHNYNWGTTCSNFSQIANDGILDSYKTLIRFALMTFDSSVSEKTGFTSSPTPDFLGGRDGQWSYVVGTAAAGKPYGCEGTPPPQEVGARNNAAPPWEGRLVNFGHPDDGKRAYETKNAQIQQVLLATRPFGATPIAGMLRDAYDFFINDKTKDKDLLAGVDSTSKEADFGPWQDPYLSCYRERAVLLLTDGLPNLDLRPSCVAPNGNDDLCPFDLPEESAAALKAKGIPTYVVGFALDQATQNSQTKTCSQVDCTSVNIDSAAPLQACCTLRKIAVAGGGTASFASNKAGLRSQIQKILSRRVNTTSRTQPAVGNSGAAGGGSVRFFSGFIPGLGGDDTTAGRPWSGVLDRQRWTCAPDPLQGNILVPKPQTVEEEAGDKFISNVANAGPDNRVIYTYIGGSGAVNDIFSRRTMRPLLKGVNPNDGAGAYSAQVFGRLSQSFPTAIEPKALDIPTSDCVVGTTTLDANACRNLYMKWLLGYNNGSEYHRCPSTGKECELIGDIFHSTPQIIGPPSALTRDESYARFAFENGDRQTVLYTSSNDGFLHAFAVDTEGGENNELWAFIPPATLPNLHTQYPYSHQFLLDGVPVVTDVVAADDPNQALPIVLERTEAAAAGNSNAWRTVLVQSFGGEHTGYFALDVTDPVPTTNSLQDPTKGGPRMLWQLTDSSDSVNLFGRGGATPAITTLFFDPQDGGNNPREIPVAVLPGGPGGSVVTGESPERTFPTGSIDANYVPRKRVRKYDFPASELGARSLTIVRLDTGEIIRTFRQDDAEIANTDLKKRVIEVPQLDSPVTGQPVAFPGIVGAVADRIYVGDNDGRLWKLDVSSRDPDDWKMKLFFDTYPSTLNGTASGLTSADSQPIMTVPVLSVDDLGNVTVNIATGDQDRLGSDADQRNFVWSLTDKLNPADLSTKTVVNWYKELEDGDRAVGPLALFNGNLYFASFRPAVAGEKACRSGRSAVWGMHYLNRKTSNLPGDGGAPAPNFPNQFIEQSTEAVVFGVSVVQQPSCYAVNDETAGDQFLGFGSQRRFTNVQPGQFQLVMHMGHTAQGTGNTNVTNSSVSSSTINLAQPSSVSQVTGWASVLE